MSRTIKTIIIFFCLLSLLLCTVPDVLAEEQTDTSMINGGHTLEAGKPVLGTTELVENAQAALLYETTTQTLMYAQNADEPIYPTSFVKIMTAYVACCEGKLDDAVVVSEDVVASLPTGAASVGLKVGEIVTLRDLLYCMMLSSANDAAAVIAIHLSGSQMAFAEKMNQYAADLGCTGTNFVNAHGLHDAAQLTTARDMARILSAALSNENFYGIWTATSYEMPETNKTDIRYMKVSNYLQSSSTVEVYYDERVTGARTGVMETGNRSIACTAEQNGMQLISIVMDSKSTMSDDGKRIKVYGAYPETKTLLDAALNGYKKVQLLYDGQALCQLPVENGECDVILGSPISAGVIIPSSAGIDDLTFQYNNVNDPLQAPISAGERLSVLEIWYNGACLLQTELFAQNRVLVPVSDSSADQDKKVEKSGGSGFVKTLLIVAVVISVVFLLFRALRFAVFIRRRNRGNKYRKYRERSR